MVKQRGRRTRLLLSLIVVVTVGTAVGVALTTRSGSPRPVGQRTAPSPVSGTAPSTTVPTAPSTSTAPATTAPITARQQPLGVPGHWKLVFQDNFNGTALNQTVWNAHNGWSNQNGVTDELANVAVSKGHAILTLASPQSGAEIGTRSFGLKVGEFAQARIEFPGRGTTVYNWPAFWTSGPNWPQGGENDVAEGFGVLTVNYHSPRVTHMSGRIPGIYTGGFHVYGIYRGPDYTRVYWDGKVVGAYRTADDGQPQTLLLTLGAGNHVVTGSAGAMIVDYVRAWAPAGRPHG